jgi:hypothetical protein
MMFCERTAMSRYRRLECLVIKVQQHIFTAAKLRQVTRKAAKIRLGNFYRGLRWNDEFATAVVLVQQRRATMKLTTIGLATLFALSSTFTLAQTGGTGSTSASTGAETGTTTGRNTSGAANQGAGAHAIQSDKMNADTGTGSSANNSSRLEQGQANQQNGAAKNNH